jgi:hypothetical protein
MNVNVRTEYTPNVYTVTDEDTGEVLVFSLWGELKHVRLFDLTRKHVDPWRSDYR